ncbi:A/G-specific adenine glycosylase [Aquimarina hainanensis]|uniref:Adenine DNA glycosylase n=1 Tax=Aquimarina hainanensis TaxID=1578017 RepID=A0ABW5N2V3_9FLAO
MKFGKKLILWYLENKRSMPWRETRDPYSIWLSEIILQQTRVAQGLPYYLSFKSAFPTVFDLAAAPEEKVLKLWQGLGYYSRARNLHATAKYVADELGGTFPDSYASLLLLKGVGDYTASAIASICYDEAVPVVDGNVYRVLSRYLGVATPINTTQGVKEFKQLAKALLEVKEPATYNQAIMEFGALQCKPQSPDCTQCVLDSDCVALKEKKVGELPVKLKKQKIKKRYFSYLIIQTNEETILQQRTGKGIWQGLYEFPLVETSAPISYEELKKASVFTELLGAQTYELSLYKEEAVIHKLSHQHLYTWFYVVQVQCLPLLSAPHQKVRLSDVERYPVPILIGNFIEAFF